MKLILQILALVTFSTTMISCDIFQMGRKDEYQFVITNSTNQNIEINTFSDQENIEALTIKPNDSFKRTTIDSESNPSFMISNRADSIVISNQDKHKVIYCNGVPLIVSLGPCPELYGSLIDLGGYSGVRIDKKIDGKYVTSRFTYEIDSSFFD